MANTKRPLRVFLCHASGDKPSIRKLYKRLVRDGIDPWLDEEKLIPGQDWQLEIPKAVISSDAVIVCLSPSSITKEGYVQKEIRFALDAADEKPDGTIFMIPARLENCEVPVRMSKFQWVDLFSDNGYERLLKALKIRADSVGAIITPEKKKQPDKSVVRKKSQPQSFLPIKGKCGYFSNEYATSYKGKFLKMFEKEGILRLTKESLVFSSEGFLLDIGFESIRSIETKIIPHILAMPYRAKYIAINYIKDQKDASIGLLPVDTTLEKNSVSIMDINRGVEDWLDALTKVPKLSRKMRVET